MTADERRAYIRRIVDAAPPPTPEAADRLRALLPKGARVAADSPLVQQRPAPAQAA